MTYFQIDSYGITDIGLGRENNEDHWASLTVPVFYALADGMGGHNAGEIASKEAIHTLCEQIHGYFENTPIDLFSLEDVEELLKKSIKATNAWIYQLASENKNLQGMGTTLCCMLLFQRRLLCVNVGDSRIYRYRKTLEQLSVDHSLRQELIDQGKLKEKELSSFPYKNIITRAIGKQSDVHPDLEVYEVQNGDIYFLCSDGLTDYVNDRDIQDEIKKNGNLENICTNLVEVAKNHGGNDNISIVMLKILLTG